jgi:hypothetical protein
LKNIPEPLKKFVLIGASIFFYKVVFLTYAYAFTQQQYNYFNQSYYTASILILFGTLGFNISLTRVPVKSITLFLFITVNVILTYFVLHLISAPFQNVTEIIPVIVYSAFTAAGGVLNFKLLFDGNYQKYFLMMLLFAAAHFMIIPAVLIFNFNIFPSLCVFTILWFSIVYQTYRQNISISTNYKEFYKIGFSAFVINSAVSLALAGDKFIVNHFFAPDIANAYTFAWGLTAPVFYIGNLIEKYLFAESKPDKNKLLVKGFLFSLSFILIYVSAVITAVDFFPSLLPDSVPNEIFGNIFVFMITGYSIYVVLHFPINTYLFKVIDTNKQKIISLYYSIVIVIFSFLFFLTIQNVFHLDYKILLAAVWVYMFILLLIKSLIIFGKKDGKVFESKQIIADDMREIP